MKPTVNETNSKSSLSKSMKKSSKSRSKVSKSNSSQAAATPQVIPQEPSTSASSVLSSSTPTTEKTSAKNYAGFGAETIRTMWEQHDTSDTDVIPEVYARLAEDATFKIWEIINSIKTYARHSGGRVTVDLVNEVFKDADVAPIFGAANADWERIDYDDSFYFDGEADKILDLRDEYLKEVQTVEETNSEITSSWVIDKKYTDDLLIFAAALGKAIFLGDSDAFKMGLDAAAFAPQIGCCLRVLLRKCIEMLAFDQKYPAIERTYKYLQALSFNPFTRGADCKQLLFHLSEILICELLDTYDSLKIPLKNISRNHPPKLTENIKEESFELVKNFLLNSDQEIKRDVEALNQMDVDDIRSEYEALFQMMARDGFQERTDDENTFPANNYQQNTSASNNDEQNSSAVDSINQTQIKFEYNDEDNMNQQQQRYASGIKTIPSYAITDDELKNEQFNEQEEKIKSVNLEFSPYQAKMIDMKHVDFLCQTIGCLASQFGYLQSECTYLITKRMQRFFELNSEITEEIEYKYVSRCTQGLISLGESAFREMLPYLCQIDTPNAPEWLSNVFSIAAIFLEGRDDIFLYEWLEDLCGEKLQPFLLYSYKYHDKLIRHNFNLRRKSTYKISPKVILKSFLIYKNVLVTDNPRTIENLFPEKVELINAPKKISFKFAGCRPVKKEPESSTVDERKIFQYFPKKIVIAKRKLLKPLTDERKFVHLSSYCYTQI